MSIEEYWKQHDDDKLERLNTLKLYRQLNITIENYMVDWLIRQLDLKTNKKSIIIKNHTRH